MNAHFNPNNYLLIQLTDLEEAWQRFADPSQASMIGECLEILRTLSQTKPSREAVNTLVMMTGYLTSPGDRTPDDGATTQDG